MNNDLNEKAQFEKVITHFKEELLGIRTGRANAALVEGILVTAYGVPTKLYQLANISIPDPKTLVVEPWDKNILKDVEKALLHCEKGFNPVDEGSFLRISLAPVTEENRREFVKIVGQKTEETRIALRQVRDGIREKIMIMEKNGEIPEDAKFAQLKKLDALIGDYNEQVKKMADEKEEEIRTL